MKEITEKMYSESEVKNLLEMGIRISNQTLLDNISIYSKLDKKMNRHTDWIGRTHSWVIKNMFKYIEDYSKWDDRYLINFFEMYKTFPMDEYHSIPYLREALCARDELGGYTRLTYDEFKKYDIRLDKLNESIIKAINEECNN